MAAESSNALDILLQALPSDEAESVQAQLSRTVPTQFTTATNLPTTDIPFSLTITSSFDATTTAYRTTTTTTTSSTSTALSTSASSSASATSIAAQSTNTTTPAAPPALQNKSAGTVAGIATGSVAGIVLILLALLYIFRLRHKKFDSDTTILGRIASIKKLGSMRQKRVEPEPKMHPESAWRYEPVRPSSRDAPIPVSSEEGARLAANVPWTSRPNTSERGLGLHLPYGMAELPAISVAKNIDPTIVDPTLGPRRFSYPVRPSPEPEEEHGDDAISPLLPPPPRFARGNRQQYNHSPASSVGSAAEATDMSQRYYRSATPSPAPDARTPLDPGA